MYDVCLHRSRCRYVPLILLRDGAFIADNYCWFEGWLFLPIFPASTPANRGHRPHHTGRHSICQQNLAVSCLQIVLLIPLWSSTANFVLGTRWMNEFGHWNSGYCPFVTPRWRCHKISFREHAILDWSKSKECFELEILGRNGVTINNKVRFYSYVCRHLASNRDICTAV